MKGRRLQGTACSGLNSLHHPRHYTVSPYLPSPPFSSSASLSSLSKRKANSQSHNRLFSAATAQAATPTTHNPTEGNGKHKKSNENSEWEVIIGLELHAQINSRTKLFSGAEVSFGAPANEKVSIIDVAYPGVLPSLNKYCVEQAIRAGLVLNGQINNKSKFDRKHYFYCDLAQGYQITQKDDWIVTGGHVILDRFAKEPRKIRIDHIQLEQDSGKSHHDQDPSLSLVDYNRAGIGLLEIVSMPDLRSAKEATQYLAKIGQLLEAIGVIDPKTMEKTALRCDVNVSIHRPGTPWGTRCEVKNVNSLRSVHRAIEYETQRQIRMLQKGETIEQETRYFDANSGTTIRARAKEDEVDYRYFPEPDLPTLYVENELIERVKATMPELPEDKLDRFMAHYGLNHHDATLLMESGTQNFFEEVVKGRPTDNTNLREVAQYAYAWSSTELQGHLVKLSMPIHDSPITPLQIRSIIDMIRNKKISGATGKKVLEEMFDQADNNAQGILAEEIVEKKGWQLAADDSVQALIEQHCQQLVKDNQQEVEKYLKGKLGVKQWFVGQVMKLTKGKARPEQIQEVLDKYLK